MTKTTGDQLIGFKASGLGKTFRGVEASSGQNMPTVFHEATKDEVGQAVALAESAYEIYRNKSGVEKASFLTAIGEEIMALGDLLIDTCHLETALPNARLVGERGRTVGQLGLFANLLREGSWVDARIDPAIPDRQPLPRVDIRQMQKPLGPVGVFGASNFPLAFSVAGGDTASALAAGCPVVVKGHPAHPGTSELVGKAIISAAKKTGMPEGVFSLVQGTGIEVGQSIVKHPKIKAIGFTGSYVGGKALFNEAAKRPEPIPVYAEMGSTNPVFVLPGALKERKEEIAQGLAGSVTMGVGQFCTNPGLSFVLKSEEATAFKSILAETLQQAPKQTMLTAGIQSNYNKGLDKLKQQSGIETLTEVEDGPHLLSVSIGDFLSNKALEEEVFGPCTLLVEGESPSDLVEAAKKLDGHLTATLLANEEDLRANQELIQVLERKVGRLIVNGYPTGVEVGHAIVHGGPFPATTDSRMTSVGSAAITRFTRPFCYQNFPQFLLPDELKDGNPLRIWRKIDGHLTQKS